MSFKPLTPEQRERYRKQQQAMQQRARDKQRAKQADPEWRASQQAKQRAAQDRQRQRHREKVAEKFRAGTIAMQDAIDDYSNETRPALVEDPRLLAMAGLSRSHQPGDRRRVA